MSRAATAAGRRAPVHPRRISGPGRPAAPPRAVPRGRPIPAANRLAGAIGRVISVGSLLASSRWMDRLVRGQAWVVIIGVALMGIVAMQVSLLQLNSGISRAVETKASMERTNAALRMQNSRLGDAGRIQRVAAERGLIMPSPGNIRYLTAREGTGNGAGDASRAVRSMRAPDPKPVVAAEPPAGTTAPAPDPATTEPVIPGPEAQAQDPAATAPAPEPAPVPAPTPPAPVQEPAAAPTATSTGAVAAP